MKSAPNGYTPTVPSLHRDRETKRHERTKLRFYTERNSLEVVLIEDCLTTFSPALGAGEPQRLKPNSKQSTYRSGKPLRHPKTTATSTFSASCKAACVAGSDGMAEQAAEKVAVRRPAPKGVSDFEELTVSLKRYPDTNLSFSAACWGNFVAPRAFQHAFLPAVPLLDVKRKLRLLLGSFHPDLLWEKPHFLVKTSTWSLDCPLLSTLSNLFTITYSHCQQIAT